MYRATVNRSEIVMFTCIDIVKFTYKLNEIELNDKSFFFS